ncbi:MULTISPECIES: DUF2784 domain-containing protein [Ramlibacter]|uniref:DUF2784 family protein n=1 Tax=Ramlibacter pinisoli TaxID=2682844 RepID=A0A6N8IRA7_9BURK|nr:MULTISPECIES: DUF2784 domain-containing protein [Ramlibacter]MBA2964286.1 DUF2784 domain-containing protein [Ramlibacter sp. CGMCC 1.13660]MVQ29252.1 DUF2784 family protein [Ramlibacter pinisoli]
MPFAWPYQLLADAVLVAHLAVVLFVVAGLVLVVLGNRRHWPWVNAPAFRLAHLATIAVVVAEAWLGLVCPLTTLEAWLRSRAGAPVDDSRVLEHWLQALLFWDGPPWVFTAGYTLFGLAVVASWWRWPPRRRRADPSPAATPPAAGPTRARSPARPAPPAGGQW